MNNTRIKIIALKDGSVHHVAQYRWLLFWQDFTWNGNSAYLAAVEDSPWDHQSKRHDNLEFAKLVIDKHYEIIENEEKRKEDEKVTSVKYVKYP